MAVQEVTFVIFPALLFGAIIGLCEMFFVHSDEIGMGWFSHGLHAIPFTILFTFINMNVSWALTFLPLHMTNSLYVTVGVRAAVAIIGMLKVQTAAAIAGRVGERFNHVLMIGAMIFIAPYIWDFFGPSIAPMLPYQ